MELMLVGLAIGAAAGAVVGWIAGRLAGIPEGRYRARRDLLAAQAAREEAEVRSRYPRAIGPPDALERDSMAGLLPAAPSPGQRSRLEQ